MRRPRTLRAWRGLWGLARQHPRPLTAAPPHSPAQRHPKAGALQEPHHPQCLQPRREPHAHPTIQDAPAEGEGREGGCRPRAALGQPGAPSPRLRGFCLLAAPGHLRAGRGWGRPGGQEAQEGPGCVLSLFPDRLCPPTASSPETDLAPPPDGRVLGGPLARCGALRLCSACRHGGGGEARQGGDGRGECHP